MCLSLTVGARVLAALVTAWFLMAVPFTVLGGYGARLGLSNGEIVDALASASSDDVGRGPAGMAP